MARWEPDAQGRFRAAAMVLFVERGYEHTTVADIAGHAGLTARTFFRHFADKREVLFNGSDRLQLAMVDALLKAPARASAVGAVAAALEASAVFLGDNRAFARQRSAVIAATAELYERELIKLANLSSALAEALRSRGIAEPDASLAAEAGIAVFRVAFNQWVGKSERRDLGEIMSASLERLKVLVWSK